MQTSTSCNTSSLTAYVPNPSNSWDAKKANHIFRRLNYGATKFEIDNALLQTPSTFIDSIVDAALALPPAPEPSWSNLTYQDYINAGLNFDDETQNNHDEWRTRMFNSLLNDGLKARLILFWSNHFVTELQNYYCSNYLYQYYKTLETYALGDFKEFVKAIGKTEAMLEYLNGYQNTSYSPNENYARELFELFTLGENNGYNQTDIVETAKALTGYNHRNDYCDTIFFIEPDQPNSTFNNTDKTIFGQTGNWRHDDVIDILFQEKSSLIASHICKKLYQFFVSPTVNDAVVSQLATDFEVDFNIENVLRTLLKSEHFFDDTSIGTIIKSPYDLTHNFIKTTGFTITTEVRNGLFYLNSVAGQELFNPVDVAGWQGDHDWINTSTLTGRWQILEYVIWNIWNTNPEELRFFAVEASNDSIDPYVVTKSIIDRFIPLEFFTVSDYQLATDVFKYNVPQNYYDNQIWNLNWSDAPFQVVVLLLHVIKIPEFQIK